MTDLDPTAPTEDERELETMLATSRPVPRAAFRGELRRSLLADTFVSRPRRLHLLISVYGGSGLALLAVAAVGIAGAGPLAP